MEIYHITTLMDWEHARVAGSYRAASLHSEGFIHCSNREQLLATANRFFHGQGGLALLRIETARLSAPLKFENLEGGQELFPHLYGPLNLDAVIAALPFPPQPDGSFRFPLIEL